MSRSGRDGTKTWVQGWFVVKIDVRSAMMPGGPTANSCRACWRRPNHLHPLIAARRRSATPPSTDRSQCDTAESTRCLGMVAPRLLPCSPDHLLLLPQVVHAERGKSCEGRRSHQKNAPPANVETKAVTVQYRRHFHIACKAFHVPSWSGSVVRPCMISWRGTLAILY